MRRHNATSRKTQAIQFGLLGLILVLVAWLGAVSASGHSTAAKTSTITVIAGKPTEFKFSLSKLKVTHGTVIFNITNRGALAHTFEICSSPLGGRGNSCKGTASRQIAPGKSLTMKVPVLVRGLHQFLCTVPGHAASGMKGLLVVT
jgi:uncharacterized cupredoxin-like copper-binding protein